MNYKNRYILTDFTKGGTGNSDDSNTNPNDTKLGYYELKVGIDTQLPTFNVFLKDLSTDNAGWTDNNSTIIIGQTAQDGRVTLDGNIGDIAFINKKLLAHYNGVLIPIHKVLITGADEIVLDLSSTIRLPQLSNGDILTVYWSKI